MTDQQDSTIIKSESSLSKTGASGNRLISRMAGDVLSRVKSNQIAQQRIRLGEYSFRPPDYKQIMRWAENLGLDPLELVKIFEGEGGYGFQVVDGAIVTLRWNMKVLPIPFSDWVEGLTIQTLEVFGTNLTLRFAAHNHPCLTDLYISGRQVTIEKIDLPMLETLWCSGPALKQFRLEDFPKLECLFVKNTKSSELDLSCYAPRLKHLTCSLPDLDLGLFPNLERLGLRNAKLKKIDLQPLGRLESLSCDSNQIKELDLSPTPLLTELNCSNNQLKELDLSPTPLLTELNCSNNQLKDLDLSPTPLLTELDCGNNQLRELDLKPVPMLTCLGYDKHRIPNLDPTHTPLLDKVNPEWMGA